MATSTRAAAGLSSEERFLFDLHGYIVVKSVLSAAEVAAANAAVDRRAADLAERSSPSLRNSAEGTPFSGQNQGGRLDLAALLGWSTEQERAVFRSVLAHPRLVPYFNELLGEGYRLDHHPLLIQQDFGTEGFALHGGPLDTAGRYNQYLTYTYAPDGSMRTSLLAASLALTDVKEGEGGFCVLRGSHKANLPVPASLQNGLAHAEHLHQPVLSAGDVILFSEATTHGAFPWKGDQPRRAVIYRFAPAHMAYGRGYLGPAAQELGTSTAMWSPEVVEGASPAELAVLQPPFNTRLDREVLQVRDSEDGTAAVSVQTQSRDPIKRDFDRSVFGGHF